MRAPAQMPGPDPAVAATRLAVREHLAEDAAVLCREMGLDPVEVVRAEVRTSGAGLEADARSARYAALEKAADRLGACTVLIGHTRDDQAEQVLLGLSRGSGARSLSGMP